MAALIPPSSPRSADNSLGEALRRLSDRVSRLEVQFEGIANQPAVVNVANAKAPEDQPPADKGGKGKPDAGDTKSA